MILSVRSAALLAGMLLIAFAATLSTIAPASAHERRQLKDSDIWMIVGWKVEPALTDQPNSLDLRVFRLKPGTDPAKQTAADRVPITGLETTLKAEVISGGGAQKMDLAVKARFGDAGAYDGVVLPTASGDYTFHISGKVESTNVDEKFTSGPGTFGTMQELSPLQFPNKVDSNLSLAKKVADLSAKVDDNGSSDTTVPLVISIVAVVFGLAGIGFGLTAMTRKRA